MALDRVRADSERLGDRSVRFAGRYEPQHLDFAIGEVIWVGGRHVVGSPEYSADPLQAADAVEFDRGLTVELKLPGAIDQVMHDGRDQYLAAAGRLRDRRNDSDVPLDEIVGALQYLDGVNTDPNLNRIVAGAVPLGKRTLHSDGEAQSV